MIIRGLDSNGDWQFGLGLQNYLRDQNAVSLNIKTRLLSFFNNCFFDLESGIDWFLLLGTRNTETELKLQCRSVILQSYGVIKINSFSSSIQDRGAILQYNIDTIFTSSFSQNLEVI